MTADWTQKYKLPAEVPDDEMHGAGGSLIAVVRRSADEPILDNLANTGLERAFCANAMSAFQTLRTYFRQDLPREPFTQRERQTIWFLSAEGWQLLVESRVRLRVTLDYFEGRLATL